MKAREELHKILDDSDLAAAPILIFANKQDLEGTMTPAEVITELNLDALLKGPRKNDICFQVCSAKKGEGVWEGLGKLGDIINANQKNL